jgi:filamentous hemagglutinin
MTLNTAARWFLRPTLRPSVKVRRPRLVVEVLEPREVPAHNLTIVAGTTDSNILIGPGNGVTVTIYTKGDNAQLSIGTLQNELGQANTQTVIVTSDVKNGQPGSQAGNIVWDAGTAGNLDFTGFGTGKTLVFETATGNNAVGNITLTGVQFQSAGEQLNLAFDSHAVNGAITFQSSGSGSVELTAAAVKNLTVDAGTGAFSDTDSGTATPADVSGAIAIVAGPVSLNLLAGLSAQGSVSVTAAGSVTVASGTSVSGNGDLTIAATGAVNDANADLESYDGAVSISGTAVTLDNIHFITCDGFTVAGTTSVDLSGGNFDVAGPVSLTGGTVSLTNVALPLLGTVGDVSIGGTTVAMDNVNLEAGGNLTLNGSITVANLVVMRAGTAISVTGTVNGTADLVLAAGGALAFGQNIGSTTGLTSLTLLEGAMELGTHNLTASQVTVGQAVGPGPATLGLNGTLTGTVDVLATGNLAPGGLGTVGIMVVSGSVTFDDGDFAVDFGVGTADKLVTSGNVTINGSSQLGGGLGSGQLSGGLAIVIDAGGNLSGNFINAPAGVPVLVGTDAVVATYTTDQLILTPYVPAGGATAIAVGVDSDATGFKATLTGGGQVLTGRDWLGQQFLVARNTTATSKLAIVTTANASSGVVEFPAGILVAGPLVTFSAPTVNIGTQFRVDGAVASASFRDFLNLPGSTGITFGGTLAQLTAISARNIFGSVRVGSTLSNLKVARVLGAQVGIPFQEDSAVSAAKITKVTARSATTNFSTPGAIGTIAIIGNYLGDVTAASLASLSAASVTGDVTATGVVTSIKVTGAFNGTIAAASVGKFQSGGGFATLRSTGAIGSITGKGENGLGLELSASQVGAIKVDGRLSGDGIDDGLDWNVGGGIASLTVGALSDLDVKAKFLGATVAKGSTTFGLSGDIDHATFTLTGDDGTAAKLGLKSLTAKGNVLKSQFNVQAGNVGAVTVGRFHNSLLYLNYTPAASGDFTLGSFGAKGFKLASFRTTAIPTTDPTHPLNWAFQNSEVVANSIGTVTLSGLKTANGGVGFGIKTQSAGTIVLVTKADVTNDPDLPFNTALTADKTVSYTPLAGDFFFLNV